MFEPVEKTADALKEASIGNYYPLLIICLVVISALVWYIVKVRGKAEQHRYEILENIVNDLHKDTKAQQKNLNLLTNLVEKYDVRMEFIERQTEENRIDIRNLRA